MKEIKIKLSKCDYNWLCNISDIVGCSVSEFIESNIIDKFNKSRVQISKYQFLDFLNENGSCKKDDICVGVNLEKYYSRTYVDTKEEYYEKLLDLYNRELDFWERHGKDYEKPTKESVEGKVKYFIIRNFTKNPLRLTIF